MTSGLCIHVTHILMPTHTTHTYIYAKIKQNKIKNQKQKVFQRLLSSNFSFKINRIKVNKFSN